MSACLVIFASWRATGAVTNDLCTGAIEVCVPSYTNTQSTVDASSTGDTVPGCILGFGNGVWYSFTPDSNGQLTADTIGSDFDTGLAIYTGPCDFLDLIACDDDGGGNLNSKVTASLTAGTSYYILAGGYAAGTGNLVFHLAFSPTAPRASLGIQVQGAVAVLSITGSTKAAYEIQYSTNLDNPNNWALLTGLTLPASPYLLTDYTSSNRPVTFYRTFLRAPVVSESKIGWVDFFLLIPPNVVVSVLRTNQPAIFSNDVIIAIMPGDGTGTHYTYGPTPLGLDTIPEPSPSIGDTPPVYFDGMFPFQVPPSAVTTQPDVTVKAVSFQSGRLASPVVSARFQFQTADPFINGTNAAMITVLDQTLGAQMWYTIDGSAPINAAPSIGPVSGGTTLSLSATNNFTFRIRAFRNGYQPSHTVSKAFSTGS